MELQGGLHFPSAFPKSPISHPFLNRQYLPPTNLYRQLQSPSLHRKRRHVDREWALKIPAPPLPPENSEKGYPLEMDETLQTSPDVVSKKCSIAMISRILMGINHTDHLSGHISHMNG
ncbi:hypothetical protein L2E82_09135 [Cichorium intybus]|uniref:Uncharacterized protein n=1 Tax=Cichorium intybus TaxID=13427 RepID=A0ACB9G8M8_CICIN|nr:hypothetical protein L2E82_09135 [Cichorium intybus]